MYNNIDKSIIVVALISLLQFFSCERNNPTEEKNIIAVVGSNQIDWKHLQRSFELVSKWRKGITYKSAYRSQLDFLIDEKLFAQAAHSEGIQNDPRISEYLDFIHKKETIKELYRQKVSSNVQIPEEEYKAAYLMMKKKVQFNYFFSSSESHAIDYQKALKTQNFQEY